MTLLQEVGSHAYSMCEPAVAVYGFTFEQLRRHRCALKHFFCLEVVYIYTGWLPEPRTSKHAPLAGRQACGTPHIPGQPAQRTTGGLTGRCQKRSLAVKLLGFCWYGPHHGAFMAFIIRTVFRAFMAFIFR